MLESTLHWSYMVVLALCVSYLPSYLDGSEYTGERYWEWFAHLPHRKWMHQAGNGRIIYDVPLDQNVQYIFGSHPHGIFSAHHGMLIGGASEPAFYEAIPGHKRRHLGASIIFRIPIWREIMLWLGVVDASRQIAEKMLDKGKSVFIVIGGITEQMISQRGEQAIYVKNRKGFIRLALQYGTPIVPTYCFGETELFHNADFLLSARQWLSKKLKIAFLLYYGPNKWTWWKHYPIDLVQVFGKPIPVKKNIEPTNEEIDTVHQQYIEEIQRIYGKYQKELGFETQELIIL